MELFLVDGTYELSRHYYAVSSARDTQGREVGAVRSVLFVGAGNVRVPRSYLAVCARQGGEFDLWIRRIGSQNPHPPANCAGRMGHPQVEHPSHLN
jgi:hypothetical protein